MTSPEETTEVLSEYEPIKIKRDEVLYQALELINNSRESAYGSPEENLGYIAELWSGYTGVPLRAHDVAIMMALLKIARLKNGPYNIDSWVDLAGYAALGAEVSS